MQELTSSSSQTSVQVKDRKYFIQSRKFETVNNSIHVKKNEASLRVAKFFSKTVSWSFKKH
jgi:hypothetical protein